jgi:hypothetical protein
LSFFGAGKGGLIWLLLLLLLHFDTYINRNSRPLCSFLSGFKQH